MLAYIGSVAAQRYGYKAAPNDVDVVGTYDEIMAAYVPGSTAYYPINKGRKYVFKYPHSVPVEAEIRWPGSLADELFGLIYNDGAIRPDGTVTASLNVLYMLKMSHRYLKNSPHFLKTMRDIQWMRQAGAYIQPEHHDFYKRRMKETYDYSHPNLSLDKAGFFNGDGVNYVYDHDSIHRSVAIGKEPAYLAYQKDGAEVSCDRDKFEDLHEYERLNGVLEEAYVLALERSNIPYPGVWTPRQSFDYALMKVCTSITSGWFREFAWENYDAVRDMYDDSYVSRFWIDVLNGKVKKHAHVSS